MSKINKSIADLHALITTGESAVTKLHAAWTAVAAGVLLLIARLFRLPEAYWAAISTLIVMQSTFGAAVPISVQRFAGTALGAILGGLIGSYFPGNVLAFVLCVFLIGVVCARFGVQRSAFRFASVTLTIVMLLKRPQSLWVIAAHRFTEVSVGIAVGLVVSALWPERRKETTVGGAAKPFGNA